MTKSLPAHRSMDFLEVSFADGVIDVTLNRPEKLNAISLAMADELRTIAEEYGHHPDARVLVVRGSGRAFCAGYDVSTEAADSTRGVWLQNSGFQAAFQAFAAAPVVRIARLHGHVVGAGILLAAACELRFADPSATISIPELDMGIPFSLGGVSTLARYIGITKTSDLVLTGRRMPADEALSSGFLTEVVSEADLEARVAEVAGQVAARPASLLLASLVSLGEAARDLLPADTVDLATMQFAARDPEAAAVNAAYAARFSGGR